MKHLSSHVSEFVPYFTREGETWTHSTKAKTKPLQEAEEPFAAPDTRVTMYVGEVMEGGSKTWINK